MVPKLVNCTGLCSAAGDWRGFSTHQPPVPKFWGRGSGKHCLREVVVVGSLQRDMILRSGCQWFPRLQIYSAFPQQFPKISISCLNWFWMHAFSSYVKIYILASRCRETLYAKTIKLACMKTIVRGIKDVCIIQLSVELQPLHKFLYQVIHGQKGLPPACKQHCSSWRTMNSICAGKISIQ